MKKMLASLLCLGMMLMSLMPAMAAGPDAETRANSRELRYKPDASEFVFCGSEPAVYTRALYGNNKAFRLETSDFPAFAFYAKNGMLGNVKIGLLLNKQEIVWLEEASDIESRYSAGKRIYHIRDERFGKDALITLTALARYDKEGALFVMDCKNLSPKLEWICQYGAVRGKRFSRNGDLGADPWDAFCMKKDYCRYNRFDINKNRFKVWYGAKTDISQYTEEQLIDPQAKIYSLHGQFPKGSQLKVADLENPLQSPVDAEYPTLRASGKLKNGQTFISFSLEEDAKKINHKDLYASTLESIEQIKSHLQIYTPDPYINAAASALVMAADGIWESPVYQHGAIGWRVPLAGWRGAYTADVLAWNDRAEEHFKAYAASQMTTPPDKGVIMDTVLNIARSAKVKGSQMYSEGYIARYPNNPNTMNHYDMNICYIDEMLRHLRWTGDLGFAREMWPVLERHLAWEKRCFDTNDDGLYDAYCCIWASDALQYTGGSVTHSSAYHYFSNKTAAVIAELIGKDPTPYRKEAEKILQALNRVLWLEKEGHWAEYQDILGKQLLHPNAALWTIYHSIDSKVPTPFQAYQALRYIDTQLPHFKVEASGKDALNEHLWVPATTNWMPYHWSINNVAFAEVMHTALAYFQGGRQEQAYQIMKGAIMDGMFLGKSPGNVGQVSFYDAARGETYRDFADPVGVYSRTFVEGLFGVEPNLLENIVLLRPSFPESWDTAYFKTPYLSYSFSKNDRQQHWQIHPTFRKATALELQIPVSEANVKSVKVNGKHVAIEYLSTSINQPKLKIHCPAAENYIIDIEEGKADEPVLQYESRVTQGEVLTYHLAKDVTLLQVSDPQKVLGENNTLNTCGHHTLFVELSKGQAHWWEAIDLEVLPPFDIVSEREEAKSLQVQFVNNSESDCVADIWLNHQNTGMQAQLSAGSISEYTELPGAHHGSNLVELRKDGKTICAKTLYCWNIAFDSQAEQESICMQAHYNERVDDIFAFGKYMSPRPTSTSLQIPSQGFGEWCVQKILPEINADGLRAKSDEHGIFNMPQGIRFQTTKDSVPANILFVSQWDNHPDKAVIPVDAKRASHAYFLMAGTTNHQQCHMVNGVVRVTYKDGSQDSLLLVNPETWVPIEQDFFEDNMAFDIKAPRPYRVQLSTGLVSRDLERDLQLKDVEYSKGRNIPGGAAVMLDLPLQADKEIVSVALESNTIESIIGLISITLVK